MARTAGRPCHLDLMSSDTEASKAFYGPLLGWSFESMGPASLARVGDRQATAIVPPFDGAWTGWTLYFASDDLDATQAAVLAAGGTVVLPAGDVDDLGRLMLADDPTGARFGVWQAGTKVGTDGYGELGFLTWTDLRSHDPAAAQAFYGAVFGHVFTPLPMGGPDYATYGLQGEETFGGIGGMMGQQGVPSHWLVYFAVADTTAAIELARSLGGTALADAFPTPYGTTAPLLDPHGHPFWLVQLPA